jgi:hypothetical protein
MPEFCQRYATNTNCRQMATDQYCLYSASLDNIIQRTVANKRQNAETMGHKMEQTTGKLMYFHGNILLARQLL